VRRQWHNYSHIPTNRNPDAPFAAFLSASSTLMLLAASRSGPSVAANIAPIRVIKYRIRGIAI
jgi:hypothetical protein